MPPGHDAWIVGDKRCVLLDFTGVAKYAKRPEPLTPISARLRLPISRR